MGPPTDGPHGGTQLPSSAVPCARHQKAWPRGPISVHDSAIQVRAQGLSPWPRAGLQGRQEHLATWQCPLWELSPLTRSASPAKAKGDCIPVPGRHARMGRLDTKTHRRPKLATSRPCPHSPGAHGDGQQPASSVCPPVGPAPWLLISPAIGRSENLMRNQPGTSQPQHDFPRTRQPRAATAGYSKC